MYLGFLAWYQGLTRTTVSRASQVQLVQPVLGMFWAWLLLGERLTAPMLVTSGFVVLCAAWASRSGDTGRDAPKPAAGNREPVAARIS